MKIVRRMLQQVEIQVIFCIVAFCAISWHNVPTGVSTQVSFAEFVAVFAVWGLVILGILLIARTGSDAEQIPDQSDEEKKRA